MLPHGWEAHVEAGARFKLPPMTFAEAAEFVLRQEARPMTITEITEIAIARGLINPNGLTPAASMSARLYKLPEHSAIQREFEPGVRRARRGSVRWVYRSDRQQPAPQQAGQ